MKKLLTAIIAASVMATPALARDRYRDYDRHERQESGRWVAPLVSGIIIGAILADRQNVERREERVVRYYYQPYQPVCWDEDRVDYYGYIRTYRFCR